MSETEAKVGQDIEAICGKCGDVWHVVVAKVGEKIAKVQCKECDAYHKYRAPQHVKDAVKAGRVRGVSGPSSSSSSSSSSASSSRRATGTSSRSTSSGSASRRRVDVPVCAVDADLSLPVRDYDPRAAYERAERITHKKFGLGIVEEAIPGKITVFFVEPPERKILAQARGASAELPERPDGPPPGAAQH